MSFEEALSIIRKEYPNRLVWNGFRYKDAFIFSVAVDDQFVKYDTTVLSIEVNAKTGKTKLFNFWGRIADEPELQDAVENPIWVDVKEEQTK